MRRSALALLAGVLLAAPAAAAEGLPFKHDLEEVLKAARKSGKKVFVDFTGEV